MPIAPNTTKLLEEINKLTDAQKSAMLLDLCWKLLTRERMYVSSVISRQCLVEECLTIGKLH